MLLLERNANHVARHTTRQGNFSPSSGTTKTNFGGITFGVQIGNLDGRTGQGQITYCACDVDPPSSILAGLATRKRGADRVSTIMKSCGSTRSPLSMAGQIAL